MLIVGMMVVDGQSNITTVGRQSPTSQGRGTGFAGPQAQRPPWGAGSHTQWATVGAISSGRRRSGPLGGQEATRSGRPWGLHPYVWTRRFALAMDISMPSASPSVTIAVPP